MGQHNDHHLYASTKTTAQLAVDSLATVSHLFTLFVLLNLERIDTMWLIVVYLTLVTLCLQSILANGLFILRLKRMNAGSGSFPKWARVLNDICFWGRLFVAALEFIIAGLVTFGLGHGPQD